MEELSKLLQRIEPDRYFTPKVDEAIKANLPPEVVEVLKNHKINTFELHARIQDGIVRGDLAEMPDGNNREADNRWFYMEARSALELAKHNLEAIQGFLDTAQRAILTRILFEVAAEFFIIAVRRE